MKQMIQLKKMSVEYKSPVFYFLHTEGGHSLCLNDCIEKKIHFRFSGVIRCTVCERKIKKAYGQGFCYNCFRKAPEASECIIFPERCRGHLGEGRDLDWEKEHHVQEHCVYLAVSDVWKVGVTRASQIPTRWIDQGAHKALVIARTPNRYLAGETEVALKKYYKDRTNWRKMLANVVMQRPDWEEQVNLLPQRLPEHLLCYLVRDEKIWEFQYPVQEFPKKIKSQGFDKEPEISGILKGMKGQYLILDGGRVLNIRKHTGYEIEVLC